MPAICTALDAWARRTRSWVWQRRHVGRVRLQRVEDAGKRQGPKNQHRCRDWADRLRHFWSPRTSKFISARADTRPRSPPASWRSAAASDRGRSAGTGPDWIQGTATSIMQLYFTVAPAGKIPLSFQLAFIDQYSNAICNSVLAGFSGIVAACHEYHSDDECDFTPLPGGSGKNQTIEVLVRSATHKACTTHFVLLGVYSPRPHIVLLFVGIATASFAYQTSRTIFDVAIPSGNTSGSIWC